MGAPDLISGIGLLTPRVTAQTPRELPDATVVAQPRKIIRLNFRQRAQSAAASTPRQRAQAAAVSAPRQSRRRRSSINVTQQSSPTRQLRITDLIISQRGGNEGGK